MHVLIVGGAGMIGQKLATTLVQSGINGRPVTHMTLADVVTPSAPPGFSGQIKLMATDITKPEDTRDIVSGRPDVIFHLAAIVSGEAEASVEKGYRINLIGTWNLFEAIRLLGEQAPFRPRLVFSSSIAVFGPPFPDLITDDFPPASRNSYGTQKAMCELMLADYARKGTFEGIGVRLPTVCIRPGKPNKAASGFISSIMREPLVGQEAVLPVADTVRNWLVSPRTAVAFLVHAAALDAGQLGHNCTLNMPGLSVSVAEQIDSLRRIAGQRAVDLIRRKLDPGIGRIVENWPSKFDARRAIDRGFIGDTSFDEMIQHHVEDELGGQLP